MTNDARAEPGRHASVQWASAIEPRRQRFLWDSRIPIGTLSAWAGRGGVGKTTYLLHLLAKITRGTLPGEHQGSPRPVLIWSGEDDWQTVLVPRLMAADADLRLVGRLSIDSTIDGTTAEVTPRLPLDVEAITATAADTGAVAVLIDPIASTMTGDLHREADVRQALDALARLAADTGTTVLFVRHFKKGAGDVSDKMTGSHAFRDASRSAFLLAEHRDQPGQVIVSQDKGNYAPRGQESFAFQLENITVTTLDGTADVARVVDLGACDLSVDDVINGDTDDGQHREIDQWLRDLLDGGRMKANDVYSAADAEGYNKDQAKRAKKRVGVVAVRPNNPGPWFWELPTDDSQQGAQAGSTPEDSNPVLPAPCEVSTGEQRAEQGQGAQSAAPAPCPPACASCGVELLHVESIAAGLCVECKLVASNTTPAPHRPAPTPLDARRTELRSRRTVRIRGKEMPRCTVCGKTVRMGQGDTHLSCRKEAAS